MEKLDVIVIGAGVIGLAAARALSLEGREVIVADSEGFAGSGTSSRNSGVIHAGIYYTAGSNKAKYCVEGKKRLYSYATERQIPYQNCQKLIVASNDEDLQKLNSIKAKAEANGVSDLQLISAQDAIAMEPQLSCVGALLSPSTGIIDVHGYLHELMADIENQGGIIALQNTVGHGKITSDGFILQINGEPVHARTVINAAGIGAQSIAKSMAGFPADKIPMQYLAKGNYFTVSGKNPFSKLIYPVPVAGGLGAHFTRNMAGESLFGPDVEWIRNFSYKDINYDVDEQRADAFYGYIEKYWPAIRSHELRPAYSGVRPKLAAKGSPDGDFIIQTPEDHGIPHLINLFGIESPGLTSSLAIAEDIKNHLA